MQINIRIDKSRFKLGQLVKLEQGSIIAARDVIASSLHDGDGNYLPQEEALALLDDLNGEEFDEVCAQFLEAVGVAKKSAVPPHIRTQS
jgi:hypothetical protein